MARVLENEFESRGSAMSCQLKISSGVYYILSGADRYFGRSETVADEVANSPIRTTDEAEAYAYWAEYTRNYWSTRG